MNEPKFSLSELETLFPGFGDFVKRDLSTTYQEFISCLYDEIDSIIYEIQDARNFLADHSEDSLTTSVVIPLRRVGYDATHSRNVGGNVDIVVSKKNFKWLGEAKICYSNNALWEGFLQLCERYSISDTGQDNGGLLVYIKKPDTQALMRSWRSYLIDNQDLREFRTRECERRDLAFFSSHSHNVSGREFTVRHMPVMLYYNPQDKSARETRKRQAKKSQN